MERAPLTLRLAEEANDLLEVLVHQLRHVEHGHLRLAAEDGLELIVGVDHAAILRVLQVVLLDVLPELLGDLGARHRVRADDRRELSGRRHRFHERRIRRTLRLFRWGLLRGGLLPGALLGSGHRLLSWWVIETRSRGANTNPSRNKLKDPVLDAIGSE